MGSWLWEGEGKMRKSRIKVGGGKGIGKKKGGNMVKGGWGRVG